MAQAGFLLNCRDIVAQVDFSSGRWGDVLFWQPMLARWFFALLLCFPLAGCSTTTLSPGATLLSGLNQYQGEMRRLGNASTRWPDRQRAGSSLKTVVTATVGGSPEFYRLIDLDIRKREFTATLRETSLQPDRVKEMKEELAQMNDEIAALKPVIRTQITSLNFQNDPARRVEDAATRGMISLALDDFSANGGARGLDAPSTKVGPYLVTDLGSFTIVRAPDGQNFRCVLVGGGEDGAGIQCDPLR
jgi:hypothetical protein